MKVKRFGFTAVVASVVLLAIGFVSGTGNHVRAQPPSPGNAQSTAPGSDAVAPLTTTFTYQGQLRRDNRNITADCSTAFRLYDAASGGAQVGDPLTQTVPIRDGLFTVQLDFGASAFDGAARWLSVQVRCPGDAGYADLGRQPLTAAPYAVYALAAPWSGLRGVPPGFADGVDNVAASDGWSLSGNAGTNPSVNLLGTTDAVSLTLAVNGMPALRLSPVITSPNVIGGYGDNIVGPGVAGASIGGGGASGATNAVHGDYGTVGGGRDNTADYEATVGGGFGNRASGPYSTVAGGWGNTVSNDGATVGGGGSNIASGYGATVAGGGENVASNTGATVGGGIGMCVASDHNNEATGHTSTVAGGACNDASDDYAAVGGGLYNAASALAAVVAGGSHNAAAGDYATVGGGLDNSAGSLHATVGGGESNLASSWHATIGGGENITITAIWGTAGGGAFNSVSALAGTVSGGHTNAADGNYAAVGGGFNNTASGHFSVVGGGLGNQTTAEYATIAGGGPPPSSYANRVIDDYGTIGGGGDNVAGNGLESSDDPYATVGGGQGNWASGSHTTVAGGRSNFAGHIAGFVGGGADNGAYGDYATVSGGYDNNASGSYSTVGGGYGGRADNPYATVAGGFWNLAQADYATVAGGYDSRASGAYAAVGGGNDNTASGTQATIGGGYSNEASAASATIAGGYNNTASNNAATVAGGADNTASGAYAFATGAQATASHAGSFVWSSGEATQSWGDRTFTARAHGGVRFYSASGTSAGVVLPAGAGAWGALSDRHAKANLAAVDTSDILARLAALPVQSWNYSAQDPSIRHIGPMAQDFAAAFGVGEDERYISTVDADGVALAAIQALYADNQALASRVTDLEARLAALEAQANGSATGHTPAAWLLALGGLFLFGAVAAQRRREGGAR